jgi:carbohydrate-selective porin OprB
MEFGYAAEITPWLFAQPSVQYLIRPYGRADLGRFGAFTFSLGTAF